MNYLGGVGRVGATNAKDHAAAFGPGLVPATKPSTSTRNRRVGPAEDFLAMWIKTKG
jgi:hypothetical protein